MSHTPLTSGALARMCQGEDVHEPVLQFLGHKVMIGSGSERFRILLNDGEYSNSFAMLASQLNHLVHENALPQYTVFRVKKHVCSRQMANQEKRIIIVLDLEVLQKGDAEGRKIGNPVTIGLQFGADGKVPSSNANQALKQLCEMNIGGKVDDVKWEFVGKLDELKEDLEKVSEVKGEVVEKVDQIKKDLKEVMENVKREVESLERKLALPISVPECPICMEEMTPPTKIVQCLKGHKICEPCSQREEVMFCPGHCKTGFMGRDLGMEAFVLKITDEAQGVGASRSPMSK